MGQAAGATVHLPRPAGVPAVPQRRAPARSPASPTPLPRLPRSGDVSHPVPTAAASSAPARASAPRSPRPAWPWTRSLRCHSCCCCCCCGPAPPPPRRRPRPSPCSRDTQNCQLRCRDRYPKPQPAQVKRARPQETKALRWGAGLRTQLLPPRQEARAPRRGRGHGRALR